VEYHIPCSIIGLSLRDTNTDTVEVFLHNIPCSIEAVNDSDCEVDLALEGPKNYNEKSVPYFLLLMTENTFESGLLHGDCLLKR
jgi:hypothetical protein